MSLKVCFFNTNKDWGGGEKWHFDMASKLQQESFNITTVTGPATPLQEKYTASDIPNKGFKIRNLSFLNILKIIEIKQYFQKEKIDVVIMNLSADVKIVAVAAKFAGVKKIIYRRGSAIPISPSPVNKFIFRNCITSVLANSEETKRTVNARTKLIEPEKIRVIYNGLKVSEKNKPPVAPKKTTNEIILGNVGRLAPQKNQKALIQLARKLKEDVFKFKLIIAGDGKLREELESLSKEYDVQEEVVFQGFEKNVPAFMQKIDIFILTSLWEGFGYVLAEAQFAGKPVVAFSNSSNPEIVEDESTGYLVPTNDINALAEKVKYLNDHPYQRLSMGKKGQDRVLNLFTFERSYQELKNYLFN